MWDTFVSDKRSCWLCKFASEIRGSIAGIAYCKSRLLSSRLLCEKCVLHLKQWTGCVLFICVLYAINLWLMFNKESAEYNVVCRRQICNTSFIKASNVIWYCYSRHMVCLRPILNWFIRRHMLGRYALPVLCMPFYFVKWNRLAQNEYRENCIVVNYAVEQRSL